MSENKVGRRKPEIDELTRTDMTTFSHGPSQAKYLYINIHIYDLYIPIKAHTNYPPPFIQRLLLYNSPLSIRRTRFISTDILYVPGRNYI